MFWSRSEIVKFHGKNPTLREGARRLGDIWLGSSRLKEGSVLIKRISKLPVVMNREPVSVLDVVIQSTESAISPPRSFITLQHAIAAPHAL